MPSIRPILPRNLTARADHLVGGNPMTTRPESGVGNAHPGLEFDVRVLDRHFLPGLVFDFQFGAGAKLVSVDKSANPDLPLDGKDLGGDLFLLLVKARFGTDPEHDKTVVLANVDGYRVLRQIMDLERGPRMAVVGPLPRSSADLLQLDQLKSALESGSLSPTAKRDGSGRLLYAVAQGVRESYLDANGVIDPALIPPGELTQNLCSPWQWDFADCYCYYWASSKPDIVVGQTGEAQVLNFQRDRTAREPSHPAATPDAWMADNMSEAEMIVNWETLPIVTSDREGVVPRKPDWPLASPDQILSLDQIKAALPDLAGLEHALCVEYLYAKFSLAAPQEEPSRWRSGERRRFRAAMEVFSVAIDEMRHLRWVNEMLRMLECAPSIRRAKVIGKDLHRSFALRPLLPNVLDDFIGIEAPSSIFNSDPQQLDGMYTQVLVSLHHLHLMPEHKDDAHLIRRLEQLVKTIIDEGDSHWHRFRTVKEHLQGEQPTSYLRKFADPLASPPAPWDTVRGLGDAYYTLLLETLFITFCLGRQSRGQWLDVSHMAMFALDDTGYFLAEAGYGLSFTLPDWSESSPPILGLSEDELYYPKQLREMIPDRQTIDRLFEPVTVAIAALGGARTSEVRAFATQQGRRMDEMKRAVRLAFDQSQPVQS